MRITRNALYCKACDTEIESKHRHDFRRCTCGNAFIDGGLDYVRYGWKDESMVELRTERESA